MQVGVIENYKESELVSLIKKEDTLAMKVLYHRYIGYLTAICSRYVINYEDVKDILQESFVKIFTSINKFEYRGEGSIRGWMSRIVVNESLKYLRSHMKFEMVRYSSELPDVVEEDDSPRFDDIPDYAIQEMIRELPTGYRTVFNLFVFEQKSHKEIATLLDIKENSSASQYHHAKKMLAKMIKEYNSIK